MAGSRCVSVIAVVPFALSHTAPVRHGVNWTLPLHWLHSTSHAAPCPPLAGIHNVKGFYSHHYLAEIFTGDVQTTLERWRGQAESASARTPWRT